jgi:tetratricopeptide (TPR) repeat protein
MLLNTEELLALINGDAEPDRLADLLDRLEHCPESAASLQVLVSLRANREEALEALRLAAENDATSAPLPHPATRPDAPSVGWAWATQGLRLAASIALVAAISVWAVTTFFGPTEAVDFPSLAITTFVNSMEPGQQTAELTSNTSVIIADDALRALDARDFESVKRLLEARPTDAAGRIPLFLGMAEYWLENHEAALAKFVEVRELPTLTDAGIAHQAAWYEANALLKLDRPEQALIALANVTTDRFFPFYDEAVDTDGILRQTLGLSRSKRD